MNDIDDIKGQLKDLDATKIFFTDLNGRLMGLPVNGRNIERILEKGVGFDGSSIAGYATVENSDRLLFPIPESFKVVNLKDERLGFFIGRIYNEKGERAQADPRAVLERVVAEAEAEFGFRFLVGPEHEFFILSSDNLCETFGHSDKAGYFNAMPHDKGEQVRNRIIGVLDRCGIQFEKAHHEVTPSQHEINLEPMAPLKAADRTLLFNYVTQKVAVESGYHATFMPKPFDDYNRNAFHLHLSMQDDKGENRFYDPTAESRLSRTALQFIAGLIRYARETSIIMASNFNSYKAYVADREAPMLRGWGFRNRSSMVRVPFTNDPKSTRIELRNPDPAGNVFLQMAVFIAMGLQGIREGIECAAPDIGSTYHLPGENDKGGQNGRVWDTRYLPKSLFEALVEAENSEFLKTVLGERLYGNYMKLKMDDWEDHRVHITPREHQKYLSI